MDLVILVTGQVSFSPLAMARKFRIWSVCCIQTLFIGPRVKLSSNSHFPVTLISSCIYLSKVCVTKCRLLRHFKSLFGARDNITYLKAWPFCNSGFLRKIQEFCVQPSPAKLRFSGNWKISLMDRCWWTTREETASGNIWKVWQY